MGFLPSIMLTATLAPPPWLQGWMLSTVRSLGRPSRKGTADRGLNFSPSSACMSTAARDGWSLGQAMSTYSLPPRFHCQAGRVPPSCSTVPTTCGMTVMGFCPSSTAQASPRASSCWRFSPRSMAFSSSSEGWRAASALSICSACWAAGAVSCTFFSTCSALLFLVMARASG